MARSPLTNLLNHTAKYSPPGCTVECTARREGHEAVLAGRDKGNGISAAEVPALRQAFHRSGIVGAPGGRQRQSMARCR